MPREKRRRGVPIPLVVWLAGIAAIFVFNRIEAIASRFDREVPLLAFFSFLAWLAVIALTLYGFFVVARFLLRKLFWTVGRRLFLSYILIGVLPFFLFAILLAAILYVVAGVATQANYKAERQASIGELETLNSEYALLGRQPRDGAIELHDSAKDPSPSVPAWLRETNFSGMALRGGQPLLVVARRYPAGEKMRSVVLVRRVDSRWTGDLEDRTGMVVSLHIGSHERDTIRVGSQQRRGDENFEIDEGDKAMGDFARRGMSPGEILLFRRIVFFDITEEGGVLDWETGRDRAGKRLVTFISNPTRNLLQFYFGGATSSQIMRAIFGAIVALTTLLMIVYLFATLFAAVLIFSISRAVNRIEKGTQAVERGDFSYRIRMKPTNQLGAMAQSFNHMTESIASLLASVAEKERLQSEIEIAASIQRNLLPKEGPQFRGVSFSAHFEPTASIGGDYYDVFNLDKSRLAVAIGDVSGHGLSTGLVMAMVKAAITTLVEEGADETSLFHRLNELVYRSTERRAFMTLAFTIFDLERGTIRHTNAGHLYPYLLREGMELTSVESPSLPLGVRSQIVTHTVELDLAEGDTIVYLSDGIIEAQNASGDPFGFDELEKLLARQRERSPSAVRDAILTAVEQHSGQRVADDDRTVMILRFDNLKAIQRSEAEPELTAAT